MSGFFSFFSSYFDFSAPTVQVKQSDDEEFVNLDEMSKPKYQFKSKIDESKYINILLLGETGVGKSTFINSFANYLQYGSLDDAQGKKLLCLIPAKFTVVDDTLQSINITFNQDENEDKLLGNSSTQSAKSYVFPLDDKFVRLIDTPGIGDARGTLKDKENFENILRHLGEFTHLHAICFLMKPNVTVINAYFRFCIIELLSRLDKSAANNIAFVFTNTRGSNYMALDTFANIQRILDEIKQQQNVIIPLKYSKEVDSNVFCFDNEGFKHLVASQQNVTFGNRATMQESWNVSQAASWKLIKYIMGDKDKQHLPLSPHKVQNTVSVNEARRLIIELSKPLADITDLIQDNLHALSAHQSKLLQSTITKDELERMLYVPVVDIKQTTLAQPVTVCAESKCTETYTVLGNKQCHYKQRCHNPCYLSNVSKELIGAPELRNCAAMSGNSCKICKCDISTHMHIYYETEIFEKQIQDETVKAQLQNNSEMLKAQYDMIQNLNKESDQYANEHKIISKSMAKFAYFLQNNSICPINDAYEGYLEYLIQRENVPSGDKNLLNRYRMLKREHLEEKTLLENAGRMTVNSDISNVSSNEIIDTVQNLYKLKKTGAKIKELHMRLSLASKNEFKKESEYVHKQVAKTPQPQVQAAAKEQPTPKPPKEKKDRMLVIMELVEQQNFKEAQRHFEILLTEKQAEKDAKLKEKEKEKDEKKPDMEEMMQMMATLFAEFKNKEAPSTSNSGTVPKGKDKQQQQQNQNKQQKQYQNQNRQNFGPGQNRPYKQQPNFPRPQQQGFQGHQGQRPFQGHQGQGQFQGHQGYNMQQQFAPRQQQFFPNQQQQQPVPFPQQQGNVSIPPLMSGFPPNMQLQNAMQALQLQHSLQQSPQQNQQQQPIPVNINVNIPATQPQHHNKKFNNQNNQNQRGNDAAPPSLLSKYMDPPPAYSHVVNDNVPHLPGFNQTQGQRGRGAYNNQGQRGRGSYNPNQNQRGQYNQKGRGGQQPNQFKKYNNAPRKQAPTSDEGNESDTSSASGTNAPTKPRRQRSTSQTKKNKEEVKKPLPPDDNVDEKQDDGPNIAAMKKFIEEQRRIVEERDNLTPTTPTRPARNIVQVDNDGDGNANQRQHQSDDFEAKLESFKKGIFNFFKK